MLKNRSVSTAPSSLILPAEPLEVLVTWNGLALPVEKFLAMRRQAYQPDEQLGAASVTHCKWAMWLLCHYVHISYIIIYHYFLIRAYPWSNPPDALEKSHQPPVFLTGFGHLQMTFLLNLDSETLTARHQTIRIDSLASLLTWVCSNSTWKATEGPENNPTLSYPTSKLFDVGIKKPMRENVSKNSPTLAWIRQWNENHPQISEKVFEHHNLSHRRNSYGDITYESLIQICQSSWRAMATYVEKCWSNRIISPQFSGWK